MKTAEIVLGAIGTFLFVVGLIIACLPSAMVRQLLRRLSAKRLP